MKENYLSAPRDDMQFKRNAKLERLHRVPGVFERAVYLF